MACDWLQDLGLCGKHAREYSPLIGPLFSFDVPCSFLMSFSASGVIPLRNPT